MRREGEPGHPTITVRSVPLRLALTGGLLVLITAIAGCGSGPSPAALAADRSPVVTTTTEPPAEGVFLVQISNGAFRPSNVRLDLDEQWIVMWRHDDLAEREYVIETRDGSFSSELLTPGDTFEVDFSEFEPGIYRYYAAIGNTRIPGSIDTRPAQ